MTDRSAFNAISYLESEISAPVFENLDEGLWMGVFRPLVSPRHFDYSNIKFKINEELNEQSINL